MNSNTDIKSSGFKKNVLIKLCGKAIELWAVLKQDWRYMVRRYIIAFFFVL